jgi:hypothetical protein
MAAPQALRLLAIAYKVRRQFAETFLACDPNCLAPCAACGPDPNVQLSLSLQGLCRARFAAHGDLATQAACPITPVLLHLQLSVPGSPELPSLQCVLDKVRCCEYKHWRTGRDRGRFAHILQPGALAAGL